MEEMPRSKRRRVYSFHPNAAIIDSTSFSQKYMCYLLPALLKATSIISYCGSKDNEIEKKVRFEVDMALVLSAGEFRWSRALKRELERRKNIDKIYRFSTMDFLLTRENYNTRFDRIRSFKAIPRPLAPCEATRPKRVRGKWSSNKLFGGEGELGLRVRTLRRILPGGNEMGMCELLTELQSYVVSLQLQVKILRSLVAAH